jgi:hypothetical protein
MLITLPIEFRSIVIYLFKNSSRTSQNDSINITRLVRTELIRNNHRPTSIYIYILYTILNIDYSAINILTQSRRWSICLEMQV